MLKFVLVIHLAGYPISLVISDPMHKDDCLTLISLVEPSLGQGASLECEPNN